MKAVITVIGKDMVGIIHRVSGKLLEHNINILDINQSVLGEYFTMFMLVDISKIGDDFVLLEEEFKTLGDEINQSIKIQHENLFNAMHNL